MLSPFPQPPSASIAPTIIVANAIRIGAALSEAIRSVKRARVVALRVDRLGSTR
jgi:hypothetical protein